MRSGAPRFPNSLATWQSEGFAKTLKLEIEGLGARVLPLDEGVSQGGRVADDGIAAVVLRSTSEGNSILADVGVFFTEVVAGCSCGAEPESINVFREMRIRIDRATARAEISLIPD